MKLIFQSLLLLVLFSFSANAAVITITGDITTNTTWTRNNKYILDGPNFIKVKNGATLTIESRTKILSNGPALVITRGCKIIAAGTKGAPIVFSSNQPAGSRAPGDWGGLIILGAAPINQPGNNALVEGGLTAPDGNYGGSNAGDNSGILKFVRIEYAGIPFLPNNEINSLTLAGVGSGTIVSYVQCSYGGDDAFEWFGGSVNCDHLVSLATQDDDFDTDFGYSGRVQYAVAVRDPGINDVSGSHGFESDNDATGSNNSPQTNAQFSNVTLFGPTQSGNGSAGGNWRRGIFARRNSSLDVINSVVIGWPTGVDVDNSATCSNVGTGVIYRRNVYAGNAALCGTTCTGLCPYINTTANGNTMLVNAEDAQYVDPYSLDPNFRLQLTSPCKTGGGTVPGVSGFATTGYRGAFSANADWTDVWAKFDPQNIVYLNGSADDRDAAVENATALSVFPNPAANGTFYVAFNAENDQEDARVTMYDMTGKQVYANNFASVEGENQFEVRANVVAGIYSVQVRLAGSVQTTLVSVK